MATRLIGRIARFCLVTADPASATRFYIEAFDATVLGEGRSDPALASLMGVPDRDISQVRLRIGAQDISLLSFDPPGRSYPVESTSTDLWFQHFAIVVSDIGAAYERLRRIGGWTPITQGGPQILPASSGGVAAFKFRDMEGHPLELLAFPSGSQPAAWRTPHGFSLALGIDHSAIAVADTRASLAFFVEVLGMTLGMQSDNRGQEQARLDDVPDAQVTVSGLMPTSAPPHLELLGYAVGRCWPIDGNTGSADIAATSVTFETDDLDALVDRLRAAKALFVSSGIVTLANGTRAVMVLDPDGHRCIVEQGSASARRFDADG